MRYLSCTVLVVLISLLTVPSSSGRSSKLVRSWKSPTRAAHRPHRVLALGLSDKTVVRAEFEDALAAQLAQLGIEAIPGNTILLRPEGTEFDLDYLRTQIREHKIDTVAVARLIHVENTTTYVPGAPYSPPHPSYYGSFYGYYSTVYPMVHSPGYLKEEKRVRIETNLYVITSEEGNLVWTCITDTFNPSNMRKAIDRLVKLVVKQMQSDSVI